MRTAAFVGPAASARLLALTLPAFACGGPAQPPALSPEAIAAEQQTLAEGEAAAAARNLPLARQTFGAIIASAQFDSLPEADRHRALFGAGWTALQLNDAGQAQAAFLLSSPMVESTLNDHLGLLIASLAQHDFRAVCQALTRIARVDPVTFDGINAEVIFAGFRECRDLPADDETRFLFLGAAFDAGYVTRLGEQPTWAWRDLAILALERGDSQRAEQVATQLTSAIVLIDIRADKRFLAIVAAHHAQFDVAAALERDLLRKRGVVESHPRSLRAISNLIDALSLLRRHHEALSIADDALRRVDGAREAPPYDDVAQALPWVRNQRSDLLWSLGRWQEAIDELKQAMVLDEDGKANTSQVINLAQRYTAIQEPQQALEVLDSAGQQSAWGEMELELARLQAEDELHDRAAASWSLEFMRVHGKDARPILQAALVEKGLLDEAASVLEAQLEDPIERSEALRSLQHYTGGSDFAPPSPAKWAANRTAFLARPDVQEAVAKVGRIESYELPQQ
jgi:tetratricopeptide (TPR) repeat protein